MTGQVLSPQATAAITAWVRLMGAHAAMTMFAPAGDDGHSGVHTDMDHWLPVVDASGTYLGAVTQAILLKRFAADEVEHA